MKIFYRPTNGCNVYYKILGTSVYIWKVKIGWIITKLNKDDVIYNCGLL